MSSVASRKSTSLRTRDLIQRLAEGISSAQAGYEVWFTLAGKDKAYEQYSAELQDYQYRDFFDSVLNAHFKVMFILITTQAKRNLSSRSGIGGVLSAT